LILWRDRGISLQRLLRALVVGVAISWILLASGALPMTAAGIRVSLTLAFAAFGVLCASGLLLQQGRYRTLVRCVDFVLFQLAVVTIGIDFGLRCFAEWRPTPLLLPQVASTSAQIRAYRFAPGLVRWGFPCNSSGYYDDEPPSPSGAKPWVACVGDSFVASAVPQPLHFTTVAEDLTGSTIQCFGVDAAGPREYVEIMKQDVLPRHPASILLCLFVGNDVGDCRRIESSWFKYCYGPENAPLFFLWNRLLHTERNPGSRRSPALGHVEGDTITIDTLHGRLSGTRKQLIELLPTIAPEMWDSSKEVPVFDDDEFMSIERSRAREICVPSSDGWTYFFQIMDQLLESAATTEIRVLLIPDEFQVDDSLWHRIVTDAPDLDRDLAQRRIGEYLRFRNIMVLDVLDSLRGMASPANHMYLVRNTHLNRAGNEVVGRELASFLGRSR
jgi:hypothetical protein